MRGNLGRWCLHASHQSWPWFQMQELPGLPPWLPHRDTGSSLCYDVQVLNPRLDRRLSPTWEKMSSSVQSREGVQASAAITGTPTGTESHQHPHKDIPWSSRPSSRASASVIPQEHTPWCSVRQHPWPQRSLEGSRGALEQPLRFSWCPPYPGVRHLPQRALSPAAPACPHPSPAVTARRGSQHQGNDWTHLGGVMGRGKLVPPSGAAEAPLEQCILANASTPHCGFQYQVVTATYREGLCLGEPSPTQICDMKGQEDPKKDVPAQPGASQALFGDWGCSKWCHRSRPVHHHCIKA